MLFEGFTLHEIDAGEMRLRVRSGGKGPPLLLLHGCPQTHVMWHGVAPRLAEEFTVIAPDLRGYGGSSKPSDTPDHEPYTKRAMNRDLMALMRHFGFESFCVAGHDRGARCGYRMAFDHPDKVKKLAVLDIVPTTEFYRRADKDLATIYFPWFFFPAPAPMPETWLLNDKHWFPATLRLFHPEAAADYERYFRDPAVVHAICEDYRAGHGLDAAHDDADRAAGRTIKAPLLVLWGARAPLARLDVLGIWRAWAANATGRAIDCGHFIPEEKPDETYAALRAFFVS